MKITHINATPEFLNDPIKMDMINRMCEEAEKQIDMKDKKILHLTLKKQWYNLIEAGIKIEEYREIKDYWITRLTRYKDLGGHYGLQDVVKKFDIITFKNGYQKDARTMSFECEGITECEGIKEWGAESGVNYFKIKIGKRL
ncbi:MAG: hypothetical protein JWQ09_5042 [Segetibacter sp.]|nr:hypothetical protein [Segetibacter sp.]